MTDVHPFDAVLAEIDPATHRFSLDDFSGAPDDNVKITLIAMAKPFMAIDLTANRHGDSLWFTSPTGASFIFAGRGVHPDGRIEPYAIAMEPCHCSGLHDGVRWNPLSFGLVWYEGLAGNIGYIVKAYMQSIVENLDQYCFWGIKTLSATL